MSLHTEVQLEDEICVALAVAGWLHDANEAGQYDRQLALFPLDVIAWVQESDPDAWEMLTKNHGAAAEATLLRRLRACLDWRKRDRLQLHTSNWSLRRTRQWHR